MGRPVRVCMTKWGERPHWEYDAVLLGEDEHGHWLGCPRGTHHERPGLAFDSDVDKVVLVPREGGWKASLYAPGIWVDTYIDIATPPAWDGDVLRAIDLDLDVIRAEDGSVYLDDEDEFEAHTRDFAYPARLVTAAREAADAVRSMIENGEAPFDGSHRAWLAKI